MENKTSKKKQNQQKLRSTKKKFVLILKIVEKLVLE